MSFEGEKGLEKKSRTSLMGSIRPPSTEDLDKDAVLFPDVSQEYKPRYLELPIQIEGTLHPLHESSASSNPLPDMSCEPMSIEDPSDFSSDKNQGVKMEDRDYDDLMNHHSRMDIVDALFLPYFESNQMAQSENNPYIMFDEPEVKVEGDQQNYQFITQRKGTTQNDGKVSALKELEQDKKSLFGLMNSFRAVTESTKVAINYHNISKKDSLNKVYNNVFMVLSKQSNRLQHQLESEQLRIQTMIETEGSKSEKQPKYGMGMTGELASTAPGGTDLVSSGEASLVKIEEEEVDLRKGNGK